MNEQIHAWAGAMKVQTLAQYMEARTMKVDTLAQYREAGTMNEQIHAWAGAMKVKTPAWCTYVSVFI